MHHLTASRPLYFHADLVRTLSPRSVAVIGASARPRSFGFNTANNLDTYSGKVYLVNERYTEVGGRPCFPSIDALPETPDCAILAVPRPAVEQVLRDCAARGVGGAIVFASGYAEGGGEAGAADQQRLGELARETGMRIVGPNCVGVLNHSASLRMTFSPGMDISFPGTPGIGIASQSGGMGNAVAQVSRFGVSVSHMLAAGNSCDVDVADYVAYLAEDDSCSVIVCLLEGSSDPRRLIEAGEVARECNKPLIVCKIATSVAGVQAAMSHTGVLAGSNAAWEAAFRQMNAVVVDNLESLARTATFFLRVRRPSRGRAMVLASSGGFCTVAVDKAELFDVELTQPSDAMRAALGKVIPEFGSIGNPTDMTAQNTPESLRACYEAALAGDEYDTIVSPVTFASARAVDRVRDIDAVSGAAGKVACLVWTPAWINGPGFEEAVSCENLAAFLSMEDCLRTLGAWQKYERGREAHEQQAPSNRISIDREAREAAAGLLAGASGAAAMTERESKAVLSLYGLPMVTDRLVGSEEEAVAATREMGLPVVLKLEIDGLVHKTEAGGVILDLRSEADVRAGYAKLVQAVEAGGLTAGFKGLLIQPMVGKGLEIIAGARVDPLFGPTVVVGIGGTLVEILKDSTLDFAPLTLASAQAMLKRLRSHKLLTGVRGSAPVDELALSEVLCRLSEFIADHADQVAEVDINPLICAGDRILAVDALVVRNS
jgi:acyl-CoA synthetase (NDP forming)